MRLLIFLFIMLFNFNIVNNCYAICFDTNTSISNETRTYNTERLSNVGYLLNNEFYNKLWYKDLIIENEWDITDSNGNLFNESVVNAKVGLLSFIQVVEYCNLLTNEPHEGYIKINSFSLAYPISWTLSPCVSGDSDGSVVNNNYAIWTFGYNTTKTKIHLVRSLQLTDNIGLRPVIYLREAKISNEMIVNNYSENNLNEVQIGTIVNYSSLDWIVLDIDGSNVMMITDQSIENIYQNIPIQPEEPEEPVEPGNPGGENDPPPPGDEDYSTQPGMRNVIDAVFTPAEDFLTESYDAIENRKVILSQGFDISRYTGYFSLLGSDWANLIKVTIFMCGLVALILIWKAIITLYLYLKNSVKWW